jgi:hypothetical protein
MGFRQAGGNDPDSVAPQGVGNEEQAAFDHTKRYKTFFGVILPIVHQIDGEDILEHIAGRFKSDIVVMPITGGFGIVLLESVITHKYCLPVV